MDALKLRLGLLGCLLWLSLAACGGMGTGSLLPNATPFPAASPTVTPDAFALALAQAQTQATKQSLDATSLAMSVSMTQTVIAPTLHAEQTATERAWVQTGWTATAAIEQTATSLSGTATAQSWTPTPNFTATIEAAAAGAQATALHGQAVSVELAMERDRMMNSLWAVTPWAALVAVLVIALVIAFQWSRVRYIPPSSPSSGDKGIFVIDARRVYDPDRNPLPLLDVSDKPTTPMMAPPDLQAATTARDQIIDLTARAGSGEGKEAARRTAAQVTNAPLLAAAPAEVRILPPAQAKGLISDILPVVAGDAVETDLRRDVEEPHE